jgi:hypothetical protein
MLYFTIDRIPIPSTRRGGFMLTIIDRTNNLKQIRPTPLITNRSIHYSRSIESCLLLFFRVVLPRCLGVLDRSIALSLVEVRSARILSSNTAAGSSLGSWETSSPRKALARISCQTFKTLFLSSRTLAVRDSVKNFRCKTA